MVEAHKTAQAPQRQLGVQEAELTEQIIQPEGLETVLQFLRLLFKVMLVAILLELLAVVVAGQERLAMLVGQGLRLHQVLAETALLHQ